MGWVFCYDPGIMQNEAENLIAGSSGLPRKAEQARELMRSTGEGDASAPVPALDPDIPAELHDLNAPEQLKGVSSIIYPLLTPEEDSTATEDDFDSVFSEIQTEGDGQGFPPDYAIESGDYKLVGSGIDTLYLGLVPERFSQDFVSSTLGLKSSNARATIPFIKKMGFASEDGTPTDRYRSFRNADKSGMAIADAMRDLYKVLFDKNETVHLLEGSQLKAIIVEATGAEPTSSVVAKTVSTFNALKKRANFRPAQEEHNRVVADSAKVEGPQSHSLHEMPPAPYHPHKKVEGINLSYTINLNLPVTTDIEVFNAIFKSLKSHLLQE